MEATLLPWWLGALLLGGVAGSFFLVFGRPLGLSGSLRSLVFFRETQEQDAARDALARMDADAAMLAATMAAFSPEELEAAGLVDAPGTSTTPAETPAPPLRLAEHAVLVAGVVLGAWLAVRLLGARVGGVALPQGAWGPVLAVVGGLVVGTGATLMGGCTSGHGLFGCSALRLGSVVATAVFLGTAMVLTALLGALW